MCAPLTPWPSQGQHPLCCDGKQNCDASWSVSTPVASHRLPPLTKYIRWSLNWNSSKHAQLVAQCLYHAIVFLITVNYNPKVDASSTEFCLLLTNQIAGALLQNNRMPVWDLLISVLPAWFTSINLCVIMQLAASRRRHIPRDLFTCVPIEFRPVTLLETISVNIRVCWGQMPKSSLDMSSKNRIYEAPAQDVQLWALQSSLKVVTSLRECQHIQSQWPSEAVST